MSEDLRRASRITRRSFALCLVAVAGIAGEATWPHWAFWRGAAGRSPESLAELPQAADLKALGSRILAAGPADRAALEAQLGARLAEGGYEAAVAADRAAGRLAAVDGWLIPETTTLAAAWLASAG